MARYAAWAINSRGQLAMEDGALHQYDPTRISNQQFHMATRQSSGQTAMPFWHHHDLNFRTTNRDDGRQLFKATASMLQRRAPSPTHGPWAKTNLPAENNVITAVAQRNTTNAGPICQKFTMQWHL